MLIDQTIADYLFGARDLAFIKFFSIATLFGSSEVIVLFLTLAGIVFWKRREFMSIVGLYIAVIGSEALTYLAKHRFARPRPVLAYYLENSYSFPSGHATAAVAFYGFLAYYFYCRQKTRGRKIIVLISATVMILAIGFSRLYLGVHYLSDVLAGYAVGFLFLVTSIGITKWLKPGNHQ
ncbi:MAG: phosphatase PAP2 family protein [Patescibacteria group bacterium]